MRARYNWVRTRYDTGCTAVTNSCDCLGMEADALGICGGDCQTNTDGDNICDVRADGTLEDTCVGPTVDDCGDCDGTFFFLNASGDPCTEGSVGCLTADEIFLKFGKNLQILRISAEEIAMRIWMKMVFATRGMA